MKILYAATECAPFIKTGGLGDVMGALPNQIATMGNEVGVILPLYEDIPAEFKEKLEYWGNFTVPVGWRNQYCGIFALSQNEVTYLFVDNEYYFKRPGVYGYYDDGERFAFFQQAVIMMMERFNWIPDILHCNDYHTAFIPFLLREKWGFVQAYQGIKTILTIHNLQFQGQFNASSLPELFDLSYEWFDNGTVRQNGDVNWMKTGILYANKVTTVSPTYAREIQTADFGWGLDSVLRMVADKVSGILNGIDYQKFNPATDPTIPTHYSAKFPRGKHKDKQALQERLNLTVSKDVPIIGLVSRLTAQKGCQLLVEELDNILQMNVQVVLLGNGDSYYEDCFREIAERHPHNFRLILAFDPQLAQLIYAGADTFLMPSAFEPCGLSQLVSLRYGTLPIVHQVGGLADTIWAYNPTTHEGTGFGFEAYSGFYMVECIKQMLDVYHQPEIWKQMMQTAMKSDFSWKESALLYQQLYENA